MSTSVVQQKQLRKYLRLGKLAQEAAEALQRIEDQQAILGLEITKLLEDGATVEDGDRKALLNTVTGARRPPWKDLYLGHMFVEHERPVADEERRVIGNCEPKTKQVLIVT